MTDISLNPASTARAVRATLGLVCCVTCGLIAAAVGHIPALHGATPPTGRRPSVQRAGVLSPIIELRQYTLHPGRRDELIDMFDAKFVEPQEGLGIKVIGQFRNLDDPNKFVWVRGFPDMPARTRALTAFYFGDPVWKANRSAANATIIDNDNVLVLHPVHAESGFVLESESRMPAGTTGTGKGIVIATIYHLDPTPEKERDFVQFFEQSVTPLLTGAGAPVIATFIPERSANTFPALPVREGEHVFVWFSRFASAAAYDRFRAALEATPRWRDSVAVELSSKVREPQVLRLSPTMRSLLHG
ncbi:MAG: NIPSNAP family protein [bacterium]